MREFAIGRHRIAADAPAFVIAEIGVNHNGDVALAKHMIVAAKQAGADCVKFQTFKAERVATAKAEKAQYQLRSTDPAESQINMLRKLELPETAYPELSAFCDAQKITFLSTPYSLEDVDLLARYAVPAYKVASALCVEPAFLRRVGQEKKPVILSTGMADLAEIEEAIAALRMGGTDDIALLQCTTDYPARLEDTNLRAMQTLAAAFGLPVGYSDHTQSPLPSVLAVALGGRVIEKHFTSDKSLPGPDQSTSADPAEFATMVHAIREAETAMGSPLKRPTERERINSRGMRRSIVSKVAIAAGTTIAADMLTFKRPATGIAPRDLDALIGAVSTKDIPADALLDWSWIERRS
jgi:N-acetylneuraminate synthase/N,N'-diacetyllegionaminate synthase